MTTLVPLDEAPPKGLSLTQPWAYAVAHGLKTIENRKWKPSVAMINQRIAIHASQKYDVDGEEFLQKHGVLIPQEKIVYGAILGVATVRGCVTKSDHPMFFGPFGWELSDFLPLTTPLPCKGALSLWKLPDPVWSLLQKALQELKHGCTK